MSTMGTPPYALPQSIIEERTFITRVYGWMAGGLVTTGAARRLFVCASNNSQERLQGSRLSWNK
jgi:FtsH-binding integral membrane protein